MISQKIDPELDLGPGDPAYTPSQRMLSTIDQIAAHPDLAFRFWAATTIFLNFVSTPWVVAEEVVTSVLGHALVDGFPTNDYHRLVVDDDGQISGVAEDDALEADPPEAIDRTIFEIVNQHDPSARRADLIELAALCAGSD